MNIQQLLDSMIPWLGKVGVEKLAAEFKDLEADMDQPWKAAAFALLADAVAQHGMLGVGLAQKAIHDLFEHKVPSIDWASPRTASDVVAHMQKVEAGDQSAATDFFAKVGNTFGKLLAGIIQGLMATV